jgi:hypothetical protein
MALQVLNINMTCISARGYGHSKKDSGRETDKRKCCLKVIVKYGGLKVQLPSF